MIRSNFPTREELGTKNLAQLRLIDVKDKEEEDLLQEFIDARVKAEPLPQPISKVDINTDIKTPEEEAKAQAIVDERVAKARKVEVKESISEIIDAKEEVKEVSQETPKKAVKKVVKTKKTK